ncbi:MAG TPA: ATP-binding protein [Tepidisphaeraceae bacterium]|nr:ATP-binding protein [Tepidisphaeraceae bacterium]
MLTSPLFRRLFIPYLLLICGVTAAVGVFAANSLRASYLARAEAALRQQVRLVSAQIADDLRTDAPTPALAADVGQISAATGVRVTVMRDDGVVVADSEADPATMESHAGRPEFARAAAVGEGIDSRPSATVRTPLLYLAQPVRDLAGQIVRTPSGRTHFVRLAFHLDDLARDVRLLYTGLVTFAGVAVLIAGVVCWIFARRHAAPVLDLTDFARALSRGQLARRTSRPEKGEIATLASSLNTMADSLQGLIEQTTQDKAELLTILSSMSEGVIATDTNQRVVLVNEAAGKLLGFEPPAAAGKHLFEVVRNDQILKAAGEVLANAQRKLISVGPVSARHLDVTLSTFPTEGRAKGLVIVAHDITQSFQYQELRKEFVANVSHELRTPLTVIKGFVETLQDGAWQDARKAPEFLATIARHTQQLTNLVSDILELSKLESAGLAARRAPIDVDFVVRRAYELLVPAAQTKHQTLTIDQPDDLPTLKGNADYVERAVSNLIDNAIKYTPDGGTVHVRTYATVAHVFVEVTDNGLGIPAEDIPRIFERFYRVDRSRSRDMGGTGLGLSIVKHVAQVHGGCVDVESTPGKGSTFRLKFPV